MSWEDRLIEATYTSPSGVRVRFDYENVSRSFDKKTVAFEFPDANGTYVQDLGHSGRKYPLRVIFWGEDYDLAAQVFENALQERGVGRLEHPLYGLVDVVPFGTVTRRDELKTASNQAILEVTFYDTIGLVYPTVQGSPGDLVTQALEDYNASAAASFNSNTKLDSAVEKSGFLNSYNSLLKDVKGGLQNIADVQADVSDQFNDIYDSINEGLTLLVETPLTLASQTTQLIQSPGRALTSISDRLDAYDNLINGVTTSPTAVSTPGNDARNANEFYTRDLYTSTYVTGSIISAINNQFNTRTEAILAADAILTQLDNVINWRDDNFQSLGAIDTGESYQKLQKAAAIAAGFLVAISFTLKQERKIVLDRDRTIIDLAAELYGSVDDVLDFFINSNNLSGSEILELPRGREIVYYI